MRKWRIGVVCILLAAMLMVMVPAEAKATEFLAATQGPEMWANNSDQDYKVWSNVVKSYLEPTADGGYLRIHGGSVLLVERYNKDFSFVSGFSINMELPLFGGYYNDGTYRYVVSGQQNKEQNDSKEVLRVVRYTQDWKRIDCASLYGSNTTVPFNAGSLRMTHSGNVLYIRTSHEMYAKNGVNHQANMTLTVYIPDMEITTAQTKVANISSGYVSHSFNQFILTDGKDLLAVDHGDAYPRSIVLVRNEGTAGKKTTTGKMKSVDVMDLYGAIGANATGASVGGFEISGSAYLIAGNSAVQDEKINAYSQRNIFVTATSKTNFTKAGTKTIWLTNYQQGDDYAVTTPHLVKVNANKFAVLWTEEDENSYNGPQIKLAYVDKNGTWDGKTYTAEGELSDCKPIVVDGRIVWFTAYSTWGEVANWAPEFYEIRPEDPTKILVHHRLSNKLTKEPTEQSTGIWSVSCNNSCGYQQQITLPALSEEEYEYIPIKKPTCAEAGSRVYIWKDTTYGSIGWEGQLEPLPHDWTEATCTQPKTCKNCGAISGNALSHSWKAATCTTPKTCANCGITSGNALGHSWLAATCTRPETCINCGATKGGVEHSYAHEYDYKCDICGAERTVNMTRPMVDMFRMYDPNSGEHFYTGSELEKNNLIAAGWKYEGIGFTFPLTTGNPVHRLYDPITGEHLYTMDIYEMNRLLAWGWNYEGIAFNSGFENEVPQYRLYNPNATRGAYHFTASIEERDHLISLGWQYQGIGWSSLGA